MSSRQFTGSDFYNSSLAAEMARKIQESRHDLLPVLKNGRSLLAELHAVYSSMRKTSAPQTFGQQAQNLEIRLCAVLLKLWQTAPGKHRTAISKLIRSCAERLEFLITADGQDNV